MQKASVAIVHAKANAHNADWQISVFVNELTSPHVCSQQNQCVQWCKYFSFKYKKLFCLHLAFSDIVLNTSEKLYAIREICLWCYQLGKYKSPLAFTICAVHIVRSVVHQIPTKYRHMQEEDFSLGLFRGRGLEAFTWKGGMGISGTQDPLFMPL